MSNKLSKKFESGALAIATGLTLALGGCAISPEANATATATSQPSNPGSTDPTETVFAPKDQSDIDISTFPFVVGGKTYEGEAAFKEACEISVVDYPTAEKALPAVLNILNSWTKAGQTYDELVRYKDYFPEGEKYATMPAIVDSIYNKEYLACMGGLNQSPESPGVLFENVLPTSVDNSVAWALSTKNGDKVPYAATYTADLSNAELSNPDSGEYSEFSNVQLNYSDNGDQNSVGKQRTDEHWQGIGTAKDYYKTILSGKISVEDGHWVLFGSSQQYIESSRPL